MKHTSEWIWVPKVKWDRLSTNITKEVPALPTHTEEKPIVTPAFEKTVEKPVEVKSSPAIPPGKPDTKPISLDKVIKIPMKKALSLDKVKKIPVKKLVSLDKVKKIPVKKASFKGKKDIKKIKSWATQWTQI